ncbi:MAG: hypothetical protein ABIR14_00225 [Candidatus Paceibacterota bacterium]
MKKEIGPKNIIYVVLCVLVVGGLWEFFEYFTFNSIGQDAFNLLDTISDIFFDLSGGTFAILYFLKKFHKNPEKIMPINFNTV